jgi:hypothetical protein
MCSATQPRAWSPPEAPLADGRSVILATLGVPLDPAASTFAIDAAVEEGRALILVNVTRLEPLSLSVRMGYDSLEEFTPAVTRSLRACVSLAGSLGVPVERLRVRSPRPLTALVELVAERAPGLLVFGPERAVLGERRYRRAVRAIREGCSCLMWTAGTDQPAW